MPAPRRANVTNAAAARRRIGDETAAARLRARGWVAMPPEEIDRLLNGGGLAADFLRIYLELDD